MGNRCKGTCFSNDDVIVVSTTTNKEIENLVILDKKNLNIGSTIIGNSKICEQMPKPELNLIYRNLYAEITHFSNINSLVLENQLKLIKKLDFDNNTTYFGQIINGCRNGYGIQYWEDGRIYSGFWSQDHISGNGKIEYKNGDIYKGAWEMDKANGYGIYYYDAQKYSILSNQQQLLQTDPQENYPKEISTDLKYKVKYEGNWKDDKQNGYGQETWPNGSFFVGEYVDGYKNGTGKLHFTDGSYYHGCFSHGDINGSGKQVWDKGHYYLGEWKKSKMDGFGILKWSDGRSYEGNYASDYMNGHGKFIWPNNSMYIGQWKFGKQHGEGKYKNKDGEIRKGKWFEGKRLGWFCESTGELIEEEEIIDSESENQY